MKRNRLLILQALTVFLGIGTLTFLLWEPHLEGRNVHATLFEVYFNDPFLAYAYIASVPFFMAMYQIFTLLGSYGKNTMVSLDTLQSLRKIQYCAISIIGFVAVGVAFLLLGISDDRPPVLFMGTLVIVASIIVATAAAMFARTLQKTLKMHRSSNHHIVDGASAYQESDIDP